MTRKIDVKLPIEYLNPTVWPLQKQIVTYLIELLGDSLPEVIRNSDPSRFTNTYRDLIALLQSAGQV